MATRFRYALEGAQIQAGHRLDDAAHRMATVRAQLAREEAVSIALRAAIAHAAARAGVRADGPLDLARAAAGLEHLAQLRQRAATAERSVQALHDELERCLAAWQARRADCEAFERHRAERQAEHDAQARHIAAREADEDWQRRNAWREADASREAETGPARRAGAAS